MSPAVSGLNHIVPLRTDGQYSTGDRWLLTYKDATKTTFNVRSYSQQESGILASAFALPISCGVGRGIDALTYISPTVSTLP